MSGSSSLGAADSDAPNLPNLPYLTEESDSEDMSSPSDEEPRPFNPFTSFQFHQVPLPDDSDNDEATQIPKLLEPPEDKATAEELRKQGNALVTEEKFDKAIEKYKESMKANPKDKLNVAKCHRNISIVYSKKEDTRQAVNHSVKAIQAQPTLDGAYVWCGKAYLRMNKPAMAALVFKKGLAVLKQSADIRKQMEELKATNKADVERMEIYCKGRNLTNLDIRDVELKFNMEHDGQKEEDNHRKKKANKTQKKEEENTDNIPGLMESSGEETDDQVDAKLTESDQDEDSDVDSNSKEKPKNVFTEKKSKEKILEEQKKINERKQEEERKLNEKKRDEERKEADRNEAKKKEDRRKERERRNAEKILAEQKILLEKKQDEERKEAKRKKELEEKRKEDDRKDREDRERIEMETIRKRQEEKKLRDQKRVDPKEEIKAQFQSSCKDASTCLANMVPKSSMEGYGEILEMSSKHYNALWPSSKYKDSSHNEELVVIKYMFARACGETNNYECILTGLERLDEIRNDHSSVRFPTMFYGYAIIWVKLNRFSKAADAVKEGLDFLNQGFYVTRHSWPGIPSKLLEETSREVLLEKLKTLSAQIKSSPRPDAVCRWENCKQVQSSAHIIPSQNIYFSDPDYKGYYRVYCFTNCQVCYHKSCWMTAKGKRIEKGNLVKGPTEKDLIGLTCFTPDCGAVIVKIEIIEDNGKVTTIEDMKIIEKLEVDKRKLKEESQLKKKIKNDAERFKNFENKQIKQSYLKCSKKGEKEKSKYSNKGEKEKSENNKIKTHSTALEKDDRHYKFISHEVVVGKKVTKIKERSHCEEVAQEGFTGDNYKASPLSVKQEESISQDKNNFKLNTRLNPSASDFVPVNTEELLLKEKIFSYLVDVIRVNGPTRLDNDILWQGLDNASKSIIFKNDFTLKDFLMNNSTLFTILGQNVHLTENVLREPKESIPVLNLTGDAVTQDAASVITIQKTSETLSSKTVPKDSSWMSEKTSESLDASKQSLGEIARKMKEHIKEKYAKDSPRQISSIDNPSTDLHEDMTDFKNNIVLDVAVKVNKNLLVSISTSTQTDSSAEHLSLDPLALQQQNETLMLELQEIKDKHYKIQSERKIEAKENNDKCMAMAQDIKKLKNENDVHKDHISKMKKAVSDATKTSNELKKTTEALNKTKNQLEENQRRLREEVSRNTQLNSQLASLSRTKDEESRTCDELREKLLHSEFKKYSEILSQRQANNRRVITHLIGSSEINHFPQVQIAVNTLNEFSARLLLADEELKDQYESLVRQSRDNKAIRELEFDLSSVEPPNLGPSYLNLLHSFIIMNQSSSLPTSSPFSFTSVPPPSISQSYSTSSARDDPHGPQVVTRPSPTPPPEYKRNTPAFPGNPAASFSLAGPPPFLKKNLSMSGSTWQDCFASSSPANFSAPDSPFPHKQMAHSRINVDHHKNHPRPGSSATCPRPGASGLTSTTPSSGLTSTTPSSGATSTYPTPSGPTLVPKNSATACSPGDNHKTDQPGSKSCKQYDDLVSRVQKDHPSLSQEQARNYVMEVRASNNGKLSGMVRQDILSKVASFIQRDGSNVDGARAVERDRSTLGGARAVERDRSIVDGTSAMERNRSNVDSTNAEDNNCSICLEDEDMIASDSIYLNPCRHRFHTECINQWLESPGGAGSTCPMCRNYIVKEDEYPHLGRGARRF